MMFVTRKRLSRRAVLKGAGAAIALPFLDAMHPAFSAERRTAAAPVKRLVIAAFPHGVVDTTWDPVGEGADYKMSPSLMPLERHRRKLTILRGLTSAPDRTKPDFHDRAIASFLTGCELTEGKVHVGISMDQIAAKTLGRDTRVASLELMTQPLNSLGCMCYRDADTPMPMERNPRLVFERLFGDGDRVSSAMSVARTREDASLLDAVTARIGELNRELGPADRRRLEQYLDSVRDVERRIQLSAQASQVDLPEMSRPDGVPSRWVDHVKTLFDLQTLALQADLTRVSTFALASTASAMTFPHLNISMGFHEISHHNDDPSKLEALSKINRDQAELFAYFLDKLEGVQEAGDSLLDRSVVLFGSDMSNPSIHSQRNLPIIIAGGGAAGIQGGRFIRVPGIETPLTNLHLALLDKVGVPLEKLGDSTGKLNVLEV